MKTDIHPKWYPDATVICACGNTWTTGATQPTLQTEICSNCHPFYTGEQRIVDTEGRVDKFRKRLEQRDALRRERAAEQQTEVANTDMPLSELGIQKRFLPILEENDIRLVGDVLDILENDGDNGILSIDGLGQQALIELKRSLRQEGFDVPSADEAND